MQESLRNLLNLKQICKLEKQYGEKLVIKISK